MRKTFKQFERVPVEVVEKILEEQSRIVKTDAGHKPLPRKVRRAARGSNLLIMKIEALTP